MKDIAHIERLRICKHHELNIGWRLVEVQFILTRPVRYKAASPYRQQLVPSRGTLSLPVIRATQLPHHVSQREYSSKYELCIILCAQSSWPWPSSRSVGDSRVACIARARDWSPLHSARRYWPFLPCPQSRVDTLRCSRSVCFPHVLYALGYN